MRNSGIICFLLFGAAISMNSACAQDTPYKTIKGKVERKDYHTYIEQPFILPGGVKRLRVEFSYTGKEQRTTIDIGVMDPERFGGVERRSQKWFYDQYEARVYIETKTGVTEFSNKPISSAPGWYRGDLHMHRGNSDGKCTSQSGKEIACPVYRIAEATANKGLDFIAVTDHNTVSQMDALSELQPAFDKILLVPGREITTFYGHANVFGPADFVDFRMTDSSYAAAKNWMSAVNNIGGIISINHPGLPSGEACMGCGWQVQDIPDKVITAV